MFCEPLRAWELAELFLGAKMLHDVMTGEGSCKGGKCHTQSWSELQVMPWAGRGEQGLGPSESSIGPSTCSQLSVLLVSQS